MYKDARGRLVPPDWLGRICCVNTHSEQAAQEVVDSLALAKASPAIRGRPEVGLGGVVSSRLGWPGLLSVL